MTVRQIVTNGPLDGLDLGELIARARQLEPTNRGPRDTSRDWFTVNLRDEGDEAVAEVRIYDEIGFWGTAASNFAEQLDELDVDRIVLRINSPGGAVFDGIAIYNTLRNHRAQVDVTVDAIAASAASFIAQAGDTITMNRHAMMMIHDASGFTVGNAETHREMADLLDRLSGTIAAIYADRSGRPVDEHREAMAATTWYSADEAVEAGLADEHAPADDAEAEARERDAARVAAGFDPELLRAAGYDPASVIAALSDTAGDTPPAPDVPRETEPSSTLTSDTTGVDLGSVVREAIQNETAPPRFELEADTLRAAMHHRATHAPAPASFPDRQTEHVDDRPLDIKQAILEAAHR